LKKYIYTLVRYVIYRVVQFVKLCYSVIDVLFHSCSACIKALV